MKKTVFFIMLSLLLISCTNTKKKAEIYPKKFDNGLWGYVNIDEKPVIFPKFTVAKEHNLEGYALVNDIRGDWFYINQYGGRALFQPFIVNDEVDKIHDGVYRFVHKGKIGFFDENGKKVIKAKFQYATSFTNGYACIAEDFKCKFEGKNTEIIGGKWGIINKKGKIIVNPIYDSISLFDKNGVAEAVLGNEIIYINKKGKIIEN